jgi:hypothetical protein
MQKAHHILGSAANLLGITLLIIAGLHITNRAARTLSDEVAWIGAVCFALSCCLSYASIRSRDDIDPWEVRADLVFMAGLAALFISVVVLALSNLG